MAKIKTTKSQIDISMRDLKKRITADAENTMSELDAFLASKKAAGMSTEALTNYLLDDLDSENGRIFSSIKNSLAHEVGSFMDDIAENEKVQILEYNGFDGDTEEMWVATLINTCNDCLALHGEIKKHSEWEEEGVPNVRPTPCTYRGYCHCNLIPVDSMTAEDLNDVKEPIKMQKDKIKEYTAMAKDQGRSLSAEYKNSLLGQANNNDSLVNNIPSE